MSDLSDGAAPDVAASRRTRLKSSMVAGLISCAGILVGAAVGILPAIVARKTFLAPQPDAGLADIGPALVALAVGAIGGIIGATIGLLVSARWVDRADTPTATPRIRSFSRSFSVLVFVLVCIPLEVVLLIVVPLLGVLVLGAVFLVVAAHLVGRNAPLE